MTTKLKVAVLLVAMASALVGVDANAANGETQVKTLRPGDPGGGGGGGTGGGGTGGGTTPNYNTRGGSNYAWYYVSPSCDREPYGVLPNFQLQRSVIETQLIQMYDEGQRKLRIPVFIRHNNHGSGTAFSSAGGTIGVQGLANLRDLVLTAATIGYNEFQVGLFPLGENDNTVWTGTSFNASQLAILDENWNVIRELTYQMRGTGVKFYMDLGNESFHAGTEGFIKKNDNRTNYNKEIWSRFRSEFTVGESVGFSVRQGEIKNLDSARMVYGDTPPYIMDMHLYSDYANSLASIHRGLNNANYKYTQLIVGEAPYDDAAAADGILAGKYNIGNRTLFYVLQWPQDNSPDPGQCPPTTMNVAPPLEFGKYINRGF